MDPATDPASQPVDDSDSCPPATDSDSHAVGWSGTLSIIDDER